MTTKDVPSDLPQTFDQHHERIKRLRLMRGIAVHQLAEMIGISGSYIYLIESGDKIPDEDIARKLARALEDDERLYLAWVRASKPRKPQEALSADAEYAAMVQDGTIEVKMVASDQISFEPASPPVRSPNMRMSDFSAGSDVLRVPIIPIGTDPASSKVEVLDYVSLQTDVIPAKDRSRIVKPFAYRVTGEAVRRVHRTLQEGDVVVISREPGEVEREEIYAVRFEGRIVLSRIMDKGGAIVLFSDEGTSDIDVVHSSGRRSPLAGRVVASIRPYQYTVLTSAPRKK